MARAESTTAAKRARRARRMDRPNRLLEHIFAEGLILAAILGWWLLSLGMPDYVMPGPLVVGEALVRLFIEAEFLGHTMWSTMRVVASVIIAVLLGWALAQLPLRYPIAREIVHDRIKPFLNSFPSVGWAILAVIWIGTSDGAIIFVEVAILTPFCLVNISEGLKELDRELIEMGQSFTRNRWKAFFKITVPMLMPYVMAAVRIAYGVGWKIALVAELFGAETGLGFLMQRAQTLADAPTVFATCFAIVLIFFAGEKLVIDPLARRFQHR
ncbi:MAG TPA: ABC transporter permease subunit [Alphaproteobacteria bacterium]|nr:ABC transporter permease subunit [Alphaproteobacteria bacterium]